MLIGDIHQRIHPRPAVRRFDASMDGARHESAHAVCCYACGGVVRKMVFEQHGAALCMIAELGDCWRRSIVDAAGPMADRLFKHRRDGRSVITIDHENCARAILEIYPAEDSEMAMSAAENAAAEIIRKNEDALHAVAKEFYNSPDGQLLQGEIEEILGRYPLPGPPRDPPVTPGWKRILSRAGEPRSFTRTDGFAPA